MAADGETKQLVLVVDDEPAVAELLGSLLEAEGHWVVLARDGREGLARVADCRPDLVILDLDMPELGGFEVCGRLRADPATRLVPILVLSGRAPAEARVRSWEAGADEFLCKPFSALEVAARCRSLLRHKRLLDDLDSAESVVFAFARAVEAKSPYTHGHSERVAAYADRLARQMGASPAELVVIRRGALLHDVGKISTPDAILDKPGRLTPDEYAIVKRHPAEGVKIVESLRSVRDAVPLIRWHHERMDGAGYPDGLTADAIPTPVRVLSVADVYDALASERPYRPAMPHARCLEVMGEDAAGGGLDPELVRLFRETFGGPARTADSQSSLSGVIGVSRIRFPVA